MIAYYRVSSIRQGRSGLGLKAQAAAVRSVAKCENEKLIEYEEVASGRSRNRPILRQALAHAEQLHTEFVVAKLDRLSRDARLTLRVIDGKVKVRFLDLPGIDYRNRPEDRLTLTIMAAMAEFEARRIGQRTQDANKHRTARAINESYKHLNRIKQKATSAWSRKCAAHIEKYLPLVLDLRKRRSLESVAAELNRRNIPTLTGKPWTMANVDRLLAKGRAAVADDSQTPSKRARRS